MRIWNLPVDEDRPWVTPWVTREGVRTTFAQMSRSHRRNLLAYLERNARRLKFGYELWMATGPRPNGDAACDALDAAMTEVLYTSDLKWLRNLPVYKALKAITPDGPGPSPRRWQNRLAAQRASDAAAFIKWLEAS